MKNLSICIPTYNRPDFLKWTLEKAIADSLAAAGRAVGTAARKLGTPPVSEDRS